MNLDNVALLRRRRRRRRRRRLLLSGGEKDADVFAGDYEILVT